MGAVVFEADEVIDAVDVVTVEVVVVVTIGDAAVCVSVMLENGVGRVREILDNVLGRAVPMVELDEREVGRREGRIVVDDSDWSVSTVVGSGEMVC